MKIGIDIGGSHIAVGLVKEDGKILGKETRDNTILKIEEEEKAKEYILNIIDEEITELLKKYKYDVEDISKIGLAVPGNPSEKAIKNAVNLNINEFEIVPILEKKYKAKVKIKNDGKCAGLAEKKYGNLKKYDDCIFLCIGTGVGSAVFIDGDLVKPKTNVGFEFGHIIIDKKGKKCRCGNKGCFETYASMKNFKKEAIKNFKLSKNIESEQLQKFIRAKREKEEVKKFIDEYIENVAIGIQNIINILEPEAICFGGSFSYYADIFLPLLEEKVKKYKFNKESKCELVCAKLKNDAGIIGSAEL